MLRTLDSLKLSEFEIIVADDHSPDGTEDAALETAKTLQSPIRVEQSPGSRGLAPSVVHVFQKPKEIFWSAWMLMDNTDLSTSPLLLADFINKPTLSMVIGSRHVPDGGTPKNGIFSVYFTVTALLLRHVLLSTSH